MDNSPTHSRIARSAALLVGLLGLLTVSGRAAAQTKPAEEPYRYASPEWFVAEIKVGVFQPDSNAAFDNVFDRDKGPLVAGELDGLIYRIPYVGPVGVGVGAGWASYAADAVAADVDTNERTELVMFPLSFLGVLRIDALARYLTIPFVFSLKLGADVVPWRSSTGGVREGDGVSIGFRWATQFALELDFLERKAAKRMDAEWGVNHALLFFELFGSQARSDLDLSKDVAWTAGAGLTF